MTSINIIIILIIIFYIIIIIMIIIIITIPIPIVVIIIIIIMQLARNYIFVSATIYLFRHLDMRLGGDMGVLPMHRTSLSLFVTFYIKDMTFGPYGDNWVCLSKVFGVPKSLIDHFSH